jgi:translation initiation factor IF-1
MAKPKPPPPPRPQLRAGDVVVLRQSQEEVEGEITTVLGDGRYKVHWLTGSNYQDRVTTEPSRVSRRPRYVRTATAFGAVWR